MERKGKSKATSYKLSTPAFSARVIVSSWECGKITCAPLCLF
jgi:hypothetical protein